MRLHVMLGLLESLKHRVPRIAGLPGNHKSSSQLTEAGQGGAGGGRKVKGSHAQVALGLRGACLDVCCDSGARAKAGR